MVDDGENSYSFDWIFDEETSQEEIYNRIARRHIDDFLLGKNSTIFVYGQTGSGKTYTMFGNMKEKKNYGIIPRAL
jgi:Cdc6-like AAA superfamily ATPase